MSMKPQTPNNWGARVAEASIKARVAQIMKGNFLAGLDGDDVYVLTTGNEPTEGTTRTGLPTFELKVLRLDSAREQVMSILQSIQKLTTTLYQLGEAHNWKLAGLYLRVHFKEIVKRDGTRTVVIDSITEVTLNQIPEAVIQMNQEAQKAVA